MRYKVALEGFNSMLSESKFINTSTTWNICCDFLRKDERFTALDESDAREAFEDYIRSMRDNERRVEMLARQKNVTAFNHLLGELNVGVNSKWSDIRDEVQDHPAAAPLSSQDRINLFEDFVYALEREREDEDRDMFRKAKAALRQTFDYRASTGDIGYKSRWEDVCSIFDGSEEMVEYERCRRVVDGLSPAEFFRDFIENMDLIRRQNMSKFEQVLKDVDFPVTEETTWDEFKSAVFASEEDEPEGSRPLTQFLNTNAGTVRAIFEGLIQSTLQQIEAQKQARIVAQDKFKELVKNIINHSSHLNWKWEEGAKLLSNYDEYKRVADEDFKKSVFEAHIAVLGDLLREAKKKKMADMEEGELPSDED